MRRRCISKPIDGLYEYHKPQKCNCKVDSYVKTLVKQDASIGANASIICGNTMGKFCLIGAAEVVTKEVPNYGQIVGNAGKQISWVSEYRLGCSSTIKDARYAPKAVGNIGCLRIAFQG